MLKGYHGKIIRIDLDTGKIRVEKIDKEILKKYIGGSGLASKYLYEETDHETDPLGSENRLILMTGPFTGTIVPTSGRHAVVTKSPLTGIWAESDVGGHWGVALKNTGYDGIIIKGKAKKPTYLQLSNNECKLCDASHVWGKDSFETYYALKNETNNQGEVCCIGQAGENLVLYASILNDGDSARAAGRAGVGAVMGAKNLKAIVVIGNERTPIDNEKRLKELVKSKIKNEMLKMTESLRDYGTAGGLVSMVELGDTPIKNWKKGYWEFADKISGQKMADTILTKRFHCASCPIGCGRVIKITEGKYAGTFGAGPEYETLGIFGASCMIDDLNVISKCNDLCNRYGMDTISTGASIAFAMECYENGLINKEDTQGLEITWGNGSVAIELIKKIAFKNGIGKLLAKGVKKAAEIIGGRAQEYAIHVKGLEFPAHDPRAHNSQALGYATSNRGACHVQAFSHNFEKTVSIPELGYDEPHPRFQIEGKGEFTAKMQDLMCLFDSLKLCKFSLFGGVRIKDMLEWYKTITGWEIDQETLMRSGERIYNLKRMYNIKCGISRKDDTLPPRILAHKRGEGGSKDNLPPLGEMLFQYYKYRNWNEEGIPEKDKLKELGLLSLIEEKGK